MSRPSLQLTLAAALASGALACVADGYALLPIGDEAGEDGEDDVGTEGPSTDTGEDTGDTGEPPSDLPDEPDPEPTAACQVPAGEIEGPLPCELEPPSDLIAPITGWVWSGVGNENSIVTTPLIANFSDDNDDGFIDLCDTPDVIAAVVDLPASKTDPWPDGHIHVIDGRSGEPVTVFEHGIDAAVNPAVADLDGDGRPELVALESNVPNSPFVISDRRLVAFSNAGQLLWQGSHWQASRGGGAIAIADLDGDGSPEIIAPEYVTDAEGQLLWALDDPPLALSMPVAVDLDLDGDLELLFGGSAYAHDGVPLFDVPMVVPNRGSVAVANFDDDPYPELYVQYDGAHGIFEHDGSFKAECPVGVEVLGTDSHPVSAQDLDGDGDAELVFGYQDRIYVLAMNAGQCEVAWSKKVDSTDAISTATFFDLLDDGSLEGVYADRSRIQILADDGSLLFEMPRTARDSIANPVIADVDGDGAAEILVTSSEPLVVGDPDPSATPSLIMIENADDHFAPTRRIWNQHSYHHTNVGEDARVPVSEAPHWQLNNGFRANAGAPGGEQCIPPWL